MSLAALLDDIWLSIKGTQLLSYTFALPYFSKNSPKCLLAL